jgi:SAM-dependent methyltransferase
MADVAPPARGDAVLPAVSGELQTLLEYSLDILTVLEVDGSWRYSSPAGTQLLGHQRGFDPEGGIFSLLHPDDLATAGERLRPAGCGHVGQLDGGGDARAGRRRELPDPRDVRPQPVRRSQRRGHRSQLTRHHGSTQRLTAVEIDPRLADALSTRLEGTNVAVVQGDATTLDLTSDRFSGAVSFNMLHHVPTLDEQDRIFAELARALRRGGCLVAADSAPRDQLDDFHKDATWNPIDPAGLPDRLTTAGFTVIEVGTYDLGWTCTATAG